MNSSFFLQELVQKAEKLQSQITENDLYKESVPWDINLHVLQKRVGELFHFRFGTGFSESESAATESAGETGWEIVLGQHNKNLGGVVWTAGIQLARYFEWKMPKMEGQRVLELGSGTGIVGLVISCLGADVTLTDLDIVLPTLQGNVEKNTELIRSRGGRVPSVKRLEWGNEEDIAGLDGEGYNWIVGSDLIHCDEVVQPLLTTLLRLTESRPATPVLISYDLRGRQGKKMFLSRVAETFEVENVEQSSLPAAFRYSKLAIIVLRRKSVK